MTSIFASPAPTVAVEIAPHGVSAVALTRQGSTATIAAHAHQALAPGAVVGALNERNIVDRAAVAQAVRRALESIGVRPRRVGLVVPDTVAKVSLVRLESVPARAQDLDELIRFHVRKAAPFRIEDAQVSFSPGIALPEGGREYVVAMARRDVILEYEEACAQAGAHAGLVDLATFSLVNAVLGADTRGQGDWLLVHLAPDYASIVILRGADLIFFRNRAEGTEGSLADLVHQTAMYYEDRLGGSGRFARVIVAGHAGSGLDAVRREIDSRLGVRTELVDSQTIARFSDRLTPDAALVSAVAPLVGILARPSVGV